MKRSIFESGAVKKRDPRLKTFSVNYKPNWLLKNGFPEQEIAKEISCDLDYQSNTIQDEIKVLLENINSYRLNYLDGQGEVNKYKQKYINII